MAERGCFALFCGGAEGPSGDVEHKRPAKKAVDSCKTSESTIKDGLGGKDPQRDAKVQKLERKFNKYFNAHNGTNLQTGDEDLFREHQSQSTYGYLTFKGMEDMFRDMDTEGKIFYDLGSGVGKPPVAAAMLFPNLKKCIGIELSKGRHLQGAAVLKELKDREIRDKVELRHGYTIRQQLIWLTATILI